MIMVDVSIIWDVVIVGFLFIFRVCVFFVNIVWFCLSKIFNFIVILDRELVECMCYDFFGLYMIVVEDYVSICVVWVIIGRLIDYSSK